MLQLWAPAKRAAKASEGRAELAAAAAQEYQAKFDEVLSHAGSADDAPLGPGLALHSWRCFLGRWMGALCAAEAQNGARHEQVHSITLSSLPSSCRRPAISH